MMPTDYAYFNPMSELSESNGRQFRLHTKYAFRLWPYSRTYTFYDLFLVLMKL